MLVTRQLMYPIDYHVRKKKKIPWKWMGGVNCLVTNILQNILFCVQQKKETRTGLEQHKGEQIDKQMTELKFLGELSL